MSIQQELNRLRETDVVRHPQSAATYEEATTQVMPGGNTRSVLFYEPFPLAIARGEGVRTWPGTCPPWPTARSSCAGSTGRHPPGQRLRGPCRHRPGRPGARHRPAPCRLSRTRSLRHHAANTRHHLDRNHRPLTLRSPLARRDAPAAGSAPRPARRRRCGGGRPATRHWSADRRAQRGELDRLRQRFSGISPGTKRPRSRPGRKASSMPVPKAKASTGTTSPRRSRDCCHPTGAPSRGPAGAPSGRRELTR